MGIPVLILGRSGSGKSYSMRNCQEFAMFNVLGKPLPFRNKPKYAVSDDYDYIMNGLKMCKARSIIIDDAGYLMTNHFMKGHSTLGRGNDTYNFYNDISDRFWSLLMAATKLPENKIVYFTMHFEIDDFGYMKPKTIGKLTNDKVCIEGICTIVLQSKYNAEDDRFVFVTKTDGRNVVKTPPEMFESVEIDNDLKKVDETIRNYYEIQ